MAVGDEDNGNVVDESDEILVGSDGNRAIVLHNFGDDEHIGHGYNDGEREEDESFGRAIKVVATNEGDTDANEGEEYPNEDGGIEPLAKHKAHSERYKKRNGGYDE